MRRTIELDVVGGKVREVGRYIREQRNAAEMSLRHLAAQAGVSNPYLSQIERGLRRPSAAILKDIARALRISTETLYVQAGILDEPREADLRAAIMLADELSERQKHALLEVYESFRATGQAQGDAPSPGLSDPAPPPRTTPKRRAATKTGAPAPQASASDGPSSPEIERAPGRAAPARSAPSRTEPPPSRKPAKRPPPAPEREESSP